MSASFAGLGAVLMASLVGSLHCVAMCGPLAALHHGGARAGRDGKARAWRGLSLHQLGRGLGYLGLGVLAGIAGKLVDLAGAALAIQRAAMIGAAAALVAWGLLLASRAAGHPLARVLGKARARAGAGEMAGSGASAATTSPAPGWFGRGLVQLKKHPPARRAFGLGLLNALLPCGWLWAFVALAASTGHPLAGAATMLAFWLGTLPALLGASALAAPLLRHLRPRWPLVTAALVFGLAGAALLLRLPLVAPHAAVSPDSHDSHDSPNEHSPRCHDPSAVPTLSAPSTPSTLPSSATDAEVSP